MVNGRVRIRLWAGTNITNAPLKNFDISVNTDPGMARTSLITIPYILTDGSGNASNPLTIVNVGSIGQVVRSTAVSSVAVSLSGLASAGGFTSAALALTRNGTSVPISPTITLVPGSAGTYEITGLGAAQMQPGSYILTIDASKIANPGTGINGSGKASVNWVIDQAAPTVVLSTTAANTEPDHTDSVDGGLQQAGLGIRSGRAASLRRIGLKLPRQRSDLHVRPYPEFAECDSERLGACGQGR